MGYRVRGLALVILMGAVLQGATPVYAASPRQCVIRLSDLKAGYVLKTSRAMPVDRTGETAGYETEFDRSVLVGVDDITDIVYAYQSVAYAQSDYIILAGDLLAHRVWRNHPWRQMSSGQVGDQRQAYIESGKGNGWPITYTALIFRRGNEIGLVSVGGITGYDTSAVGSLAGLIDRRMRQ